MIKVNGREMEWRSGMTIQDVLDDCGYSFRMIAVWVDGVPFRREQFSVAPVHDGAEVQALHMISGG
ncbi:MAG: sulfur carrier protein ThiS [Synergistaceae bacterium]|nr:sulfur carrier protein ThiS [Synergistota bacterium]NLM70679.1 sulfur carrier protein ThiS [Synergistaceae bacterium]